MKRVVLLLVDGLRPDLAERMLEAGELPELASLTADGSMARGVTAFPATTTVSYLPFLTGCSPGRCNVPSIRWMDRASYGGRWWRDREAIRSYCGYQAGWVNRDLDPGIPTIFELVPESVGIFTPIARGLTPERDPSRSARKLWGAVAHAFPRWHQPADNTVARHLLREIERPWRFIFAQFPAVDGYSHQSTPESASVRRAFRAIDAVVGKLRDRLDARGELRDTLILVVSDHGASVIRHHLDLADWFRAQGVPTLSHPVLWERTPRAAVMVAGNGSAMVYAEPGTPRTARWTMERLREPGSFGVARDLVAALVAEPAVAFVAAETKAGKETLTVVSREGTALVSRDDEGRITYAPRRGDPMALGGPGSLFEREWLESSWDRPFPDAPVQLLDQFRSRRTGDLVIVAAEGYDLRKRFEIPEHKSGHGSLIRAHMQVPIWSSHPGLTTPLRTVDLFPAVLEWLGAAVPAEIDGTSIWHPAEPVPV